MKNEAQIIHDHFSKLGRKGGKSRSPAKLAALLINCRKPRPRARKKKEILK